MGRFEIWKDGRGSGNAREPTLRSDCTPQAGVEVSATSGTRFLRKSEVGTTQRGKWLGGGGMASQTADIGRYEARCGVPRPPPQPTGTMGPPGPCPVPLAPWGDAQAPEPRPIQQAARSAVSLVWPCVGDLHPPTHLGWEWEVPTTPGATRGHWGGAGRVSRRWGASMAKKSLQWVVLGQNPS